jgi:hypothetical protein
MKTDKQKLFEAFEKVCGIKFMNESNNNKLLEENWKNLNLSNKEKNILNNIINENNLLNEDNFNNIINNVKKYASKGLLTTGIITALLSIPNITQAQSNEIKKIANIEQIENTITLNELINLIEKNPKELFYKINEDYDNFNNIIKNIFKNKDNIDKFEDWKKNYFIDRGLAIISSSHPNASDDIKGGLSIKNIEHFNDVIERNKNITKIMSYTNGGKEEYDTILDISKIIKKIYWSL